MEEFNLDLKLDEAAEARIAHVEFLEGIKDWGGKMGEIISPFSIIAQILMNEDSSVNELENASRMFPLGLKLTIDHLNELYDILQKEAVNVLGAPFQWHSAHHPECDGTNKNCGHQDHWA